MPNFCVTAFSLPCVCLHGMPYAETALFGQITVLRWPCGISVAGGNLICLGNGTSTWCAGGLGKLLSFFLLKNLGLNHWWRLFLTVLCPCSWTLECVCSNTFAESLWNAPPSFTVPLTYLPVFRFSACTWLSPAFMCCPSSLLFQVQQWCNITALSAGNPHGAARRGSQPILAHRSQPPYRNHRRSGVLFQHGHLSAGKETEQQPSPGQLLKKFMLLLLPLHISESDYSRLDVIKKLVYVKQADFIYFGSKLSKSQSGSCCQHWI